MRSFSEKKEHHFNNSLSFQIHSQDMTVYVRPPHRQDCSLKLLKKLAYLDFELLSLLCLRE